MKSGHQSAFSVYIEGGQTMPVGDGTPVASSIISWSAVDVSGEIARVSISTDNVPTNAQITAFRTALGNVTNARVESQKASAEELYPPGAVTPFDEAYASNATKAVFIFYSYTDDRTKRLEVPAPDASLFTVDGNTVDVSNALVTALVSAYQAIVGADYGLRRAFLTGRTRKARINRLSPGAVEPGVGANPPALPGA